LAQLIDDPALRDHAVADVMQKPFQFVPADSTLDVLSSMLSRENPAVMVRDAQNLPRIITQHDLLESLAG
jgi:cystathionine beta-synthase